MGDPTPTLYFNFTANEYLPILPKWQADTIGSVMILRERWLPTDDIRALDLSQMEVIRHSPIFKGASMIQP
jgi:hypothetical protein